MHPISTELVSSPRQDYLKRLPEEYYIGNAVVHWSLTIDQRKIGWLDPLFHARFRELLTHSTFRYNLACPIYCLMSDHIHMLWTGLADDSHQLNAMKHFRTRLNDLLKALGFELQQQAYDHVLKDEERIESAFASICEYIARNPERAGLVPIDGYTEYPYTGCLVPGYPELSPFDSDFWTRFPRACSYLRSQWIQQ